MTKLIGRYVAYIGAELWEKGGWTGKENYDDLSVIGKLGYHLFCTGLTWSGITRDHLIADLEKHSQKTEL